MWRLLVTEVLLMVAIVEGAHRSRRQAEFTCEGSETMVRSPLEYEDDVTCKDVIARPPDRYKVVYRRTCQRWLGLSEMPDSVADSYVEKCYQFTNGTAKYSAKVCCFGTTSAQRCFACDKSANTYECTYGGKVVTCPAGQVCMTQSKDYTHNTYSKGYRYAKCAAANVCSALQGNNSQTCSYTVIGSPPLCTYCCTGPFCNHLLDDEYLWFYDDACKSRPCWNGGTCVLNSTTSSGYHCLCPSGYTGYHCQTNTNTLTCYNGGVLSYHGDDPICYCPISKTGKQCEQTATICPSSANYPCYNGGTCYNHTASGSGFRCLCADGWIGAHCEQKAVLECKSNSTYYKIDSTYRTYGLSYNSWNCTYRKEFVERYYTSVYTHTCKYHMRPSGREYFQEGVHGSVGRLESISLYKCNIGEGFLRYQYQMCCPSCYSNPCMNGGWCEQNSEWDYVCQCRYGYEGRNCENRINMCIISGDPHYKTIDGKQIHFQGPCKYNLMSRSQANNGLPEFSIYGKNERRGSNTQVTYPSYFEIHYTGYVIKLKRDGLVTVNDEVVYPDRSYNPYFKITKNGRFTRFQSSEGLIVEYDGSWLGLIKAPDSFREKVDGLCGNFDGDPDNDMMTSGKVASTNYAEIGNSWQVNDPDDPMCTGPTSDNPPQCNTSTKQLVQQSDYCGLLKASSSVFGSCLAKSGQLADSFYESCEYDVCANQANLTVAREAACAILATFAAHCQSIAVPVLWRTAASCPGSCPQGMRFEEKTSACAATCEVPDGPEKCAYPETENCVCPDDDMVVINGTCQKPEMCTCPGGKKVGTSWLSTDCSVQYKCETCKECTKRKVARLYEYDYSCENGQVCRVSNGVGQCVQCKVDGGWGPWSEWSACSSARSQIRHRSCNNPTPQCGGSPCSGSDSETKTCSPGSDKAIVPDPPKCAPDFDFQRACSECNLYQNPNMFVANPCSCGTYYQCRRNQLLGDYYDVYERPCDPCTCWNQDKLTCDHDPEGKNPDHKNCTKSLSWIETVISHGVYCIVGGRRFKSVPSRPTKYIDEDAGGVMMSCPPGTVFSVRSCHCVFGNINAVSAKTPILCLDFNDKEHPLKNDKGVYVSMSSHFTVLEEGVEGTALKFSGDRLEIPFFNNKDMKQLAISLWYKADAKHSASQTLVCLDDCTASTQASFAIDINSNGVGGSLRTTARLEAFDKTLAAANTWHHVVLSYDGSTLKFYLDGRLQHTKSLSGSIARVHCPLLIGSTYDSNYFYGLMDQVCFFEEPLSDEDVRGLYNQFSL